MHSGSPLLRQTKTHGTSLSLYRITTKKHGSADSLSLSNTQKTAGVSRASHLGWRNQLMRRSWTRPFVLVKNELDLHHHTIHQGSELPIFPPLYLHKADCSSSTQLIYEQHPAMDKRRRAESGVIRSAETPAEVRIDISDTGPGIAPENINQVFDPFFTTKKVGCRNGARVVVSYNIIKKNGGRMEVNSRPGQGACFSIFLPLAGHTIAEG